jgi:hypothetical protein
MFETRGGSINRHVVVRDTNEKYATVTVSTSIDNVYVRGNIAKHVIVRDNSGRHVMML